MNIKINHKLRRLGIVILALAGVGGWLVVNPASYETEVVGQVAEAAEGGGQDADGGGSGDAQSGGESSESAAAGPLATAVLAKLETKGRAPKTGYTREQFYGGWPTVDGCSLRQRIILRDFGETAVLEPEKQCNVIAGEFVEPYTGEFRRYTERAEISSGIQIDHIVALSDAWQKGAQNLTKEERYSVATDPLNLIAADGPANMQKGDGDAATWLPANKSFRCQYVARQISVKYKYHLWVTEAERGAMEGILEKCPEERATGVSL